MNACFVSVVWGLLIGAVLGYYSVILYYIITKGLKGDS